MTTIATVKLSLTSTDRQSRLTLDIELNKRSFQEEEVRAGYADPQAPVREIARILERLSADLTDNPAMTQALCDLGGNLTGEYILKNGI